MSDNDQLDVSAFNWAVLHRPNYIDVEHHYDLHRWNKTAEEAHAFFARFSASEEPCDIIIGQIIGERPRGLSGAYLPTPEFAMNGGEYLFIRPDYYTRKCPTPAGILPATRLEAIRRFEEIWCPHPNTCFLMAVFDRYKSEAKPYPKSRMPRPAPAEPSRTQMRIEHAQRMRSELASAMNAHDFTNPIGR